MSHQIDLPTVMTESGLQPQPPATLLAQLLAGVSAVVPGYTANLPGSLVEDISSTDVGALVTCDTARVETVNSLTPRGANAFLLAQLGQMLGVPLGVGSNTSVLVTFTGTPGFVVAKGFTVSDGTYQYIVQTGGIVGDANPTTGLGSTIPLFALASLSGTWAVPAGTVTRLVTSVPSSVTLSVVNQLPGTPGSGAETLTSYRTRVLQANLAASQGMVRYLKTLLGNVSGVQQRLIDVQQTDSGGWMIIVGGGDPYEVANAIWTALFDVSSLSGSELFVADISQASPAVVETFLNHGFAAGDDIEIANVDPNDYDGSYAVVSSLTEKTFSLGTRYAANNIATISWSGGTVTVTTSSPHGLTSGSTIAIAGCVPTEYNGTFTCTVVDDDEFTYPLMSDPGSITTPGQLSAGIALFDSTGLPAWVSGGLITPNPRNIEVSITDYPDTYVIPYVVPPQQTVTMTVTWDTISTNVVSSAAVAQAASEALAAYVNAVNVGHPLNLYQMESAFAESVHHILAPELISVLEFAVSINGVATPVTVGTGLFQGDPQSYFFAESAGISVVQA